MAIHYRNDDTGESRENCPASLVPYNMLNGEIWQDDGSKWVFKNGVMIVANPPKKPVSEASE